MESDALPMRADSNLRTLEAFYSAFSARDGEGMSACYHDNARFQDPVFDLHGAEVGAMWRMLCSRGKDLRVETSNLKTDNDSGSTDWQAWYSFSTTGRSVHNVVHSQFRFADGRIVEQIDTFSFASWSRQALGSIGLLLGWTPMLKRKVRANARTALASFMANENPTR